MGNGLNSNSSASHCPCSPRVPCRLIPTSCSPVVSRPAHGAHESVPRGSLHTQRGTCRNCFLRASPKASLKPDAQKMPVDLAGGSGASPQVGGNWEGYLANSIVTPPLSQSPGRTARSETHSWQGRKQSQVPGRTSLLLQRCESLF